MIRLILSLSFALVSLSTQGQVPVNPRLQVQAEQFGRQVLEVTDGVYVAIGFGLANSVLIQGNDGIVIVDATESDAVAQEIKAEFDQIAEGPVRAIVYTHNHRDHTLGADVFANGSQTKIYAHGSFSEHELANNPARAGISLRSRRQFGLLLPPSDRPNAGIGPALRIDLIGQDGLLLPTSTFSDQMEVIVAGVRLRMVHAPGETDDQIYVYLPELGVLMPGDNYYYGFPNLYAIRGTSPRNVSDWILSLDKMIAENAEFLVPSHTMPVVGREPVAARLSAYRDAIQSVHDQTVAGINQGLTPGQIVERVSLPPQFAESFLDETYGTAEWSVRSIFDSYMGWFSGNPTDLFPLSPAAEAERVAELAGGLSALSRKAQAACLEEDFQWCIELLDHLIVLQYESNATRNLKANALEALAERQISANARNYYLASAMELRQAIDQ